MTRKRSCQRLDLFNAREQNSLQSLVVGVGRHLGRGHDPSEGPSADFYAARQACVSICS